MDFFLNFIASQLVWFLLPKIISHALLRQLYFIRYGRNTSLHPQPGSAGYNRSFKVVFGLVVLSFFTACLLKEIVELPPSYYSFIGVSRRNIDSELKPRFRELMRKYHPDKAMHQMDHANFIKLKERFDVVKNDQQRVLYDVFGPKIYKAVTSTITATSISDANVWKLCSSTAFYETLIFYVGAFFSVLFHYYVTDSSAPVFWRLLLLLIPFRAEVGYFVNGPSFSCSALEFFLGSLPVYQQNRVLRSLLSYLGLALSHLQRLFYSSPGVSITREQIIDFLVRSIDATSTATDSLFQHFFEPFLNDQAQFAKLQIAMNTLAANSDAGAAASSRANAGSSSSE